MNWRRICGRAALCVALALALAVGAFAAEFGLEGVPGTNTYGGQPAKYIFFFIGDGTGLPQVTATGLYLSAMEDPKSPKTGLDRLCFTRFPAVGLTTTWSANSTITDSAPAGTTLASGFKTDNNVIGVDPTGKVAFRSMAVALKEERGFKIGVISSVGLNHATPASFYAHQYDRNAYYEIALQLPASGFDYFGGGGIMEPKGKKEDRRDIYEVVKDAGYKVANTKADILALAPGQGKVLAVNPVLDSEWAMPYDIDRTEASLSLADFTRKGIELLDNPNGFFLMVEGGKIDWACHANDVATVVHDVIAFDAAIDEAIAFAQKHPRETLIVVTGDHETGGLSNGFALTKYSTYANLLDWQKGSCIAFDAKLAEFRVKHDAANAKIEDILPLVKDFFGLARYSEEETKSLKDLAKIGHAPAKAALKKAITDQEWALLTTAFEEWKKPKKERSKSDAATIAWGGYDPLTVTLTHILDNKAGFGWSTYSHSGLPVVTYAMGVGERMFLGLYDNSDVAVKIMAIGGVAPKQYPAK